MATKLLKLEVEDINTSKIGINFQLETTEGDFIVFSREAMEELITDYEYMLSEERAEEERETERQPRYSGSEMCEAIREAKNIIAAGQNRYGFSVAEIAQAILDEKKLLTEEFEQAFFSPQIFLVDEDITHMLVFKEFCERAQQRGYDTECIPQEWLVEIFRQDEKLKW